MVVQFKERGILFNGYGIVKDDIGNYKNERYETVFKRIAEIIDTSVKTTIKECKWLGEITSKRWIQEIRCYNYAGADWSGRANYTNNMQKGVLQINLAHIFPIAAAKLPIDQILREILDHELAHFWYRNNDTSTWSDAVKAIGKPIDMYSDDHKDTWSPELFANEIHSIMSEFLVARKDMSQCMDTKVFQEYKKLFLEMHR